MFKGNEMKRSEKIKLIHDNITKRSSNRSFESIFREVLNRDSAPKPQDEALKPSPILGSDFSAEAIFRDLGAEGAMEKAKVPASRYIAFLEKHCGMFSFSSDTSDTSSYVTVDIVALSREMQGREFPLNLLN